MFGDIDSNFVTFFSIDIGGNSIKLKNNNLCDDNFYDYDPGSINQVRLMGWYIRLKRHKAYEKKQANNYCL